MRPESHWDGLRYDNERGRRWWMTKAASCPCLGREHKTEQASLWLCDEATPSLQQSMPTSGSTCRLAGRTQRKTYSGTPSKVNWSSLRKTGCINVSIETHPALRPVTYWKRKGNADQHAIQPWSCLSNTAIAWQERTLLRQSLRISVPSTVRLHRIMRCRCNIATASRHLNRS